MWNDFILCVEMVLFASLLMCAFPTSEFQGGIPDSRFMDNVKSVLSVRDVVQVGRCFVYIYMYTLFMAYVCSIYMHALCCAPAGCVPQLHACLPRLCPATVRKGGAGGGPHEDIPGRQSGQRGH